MNVADNKAPKFNQRNYLLSGVSKRLPTGVDLLKVYPGQIDLFIQDIDRDAQGQLQDEFQIIIQGKYNNFWGKSAVCLQKNQLSLFTFLQLFSYFQSLKMYLKCH